MSSKKVLLPKPFWVVWAIEFWERFGYYGMQTLIALYFTQQMGYSAKQSMVICGVFVSFTYGFIWLGGKIGDQVLGAKRTLFLGAVILMCSYASLGAATKATVFYSLAGVVVGNALFKANPSSLISKLFAKGDPALDAAMTMYYMAINVGSLCATAFTPLIAQNLGWNWAFYVCAMGLFAGLVNYLLLRHWLRNVATEAGKAPLSWTRFSWVLIGSAVSLVTVAQLLTHPLVANILVYIVVAGGLGYFLKVAFTLPGKARVRMLVAALLVIEGFIFFVLYIQPPTSLMFLAKNNIRGVLFGWHIPPTEYYFLNPLVIVIMSPILAWFYHRIYATHITKFCIGMTLCAVAFLLFWFPAHYNDHGYISMWWMPLTYFFQSTGELLISGLGLAMVAELCPRQYSGLVMGIWFLALMLAGPVAGWIGGLTQPPAHQHLTTLQSLHIYTRIFIDLGWVVLAVSALMWLSRPWLNRVIATSKS